MIWFTSDLHLGHRAAISMCERPFETVEEMNEILICNFNSYVKKNDTVYILGDIAHRSPIADVNLMIDRLNGKKILCKGNHDKKYDENLYDVPCGLGIELKAGQSVWVTVPCGMKNIKDMYISGIRGTKIT